MGMNSSAVTAFRDWYRHKRGVDFNSSGPDHDMQGAFVAGVKWLSRTSGNGGGHDIYTMNADQLRERLIAALLAEERANARICELEDAANVRADA